ncbi:sulfotransferase family protein [Mucilaginibacter agri]|uniref:Sulfotransferase family protein n=1 Tax=Mucilaginibacter agri TaxID=2695265 RepID=A0A965ZFR8_9SPHI|nr:sulfotransferase family protein [Mucilaginibacter agri]NCD70233.1 sulfotransferase family protein [Mucilaginibacter agri]
MNNNSDITNWLPYNLNATDGYSCKWVYTDKIEYTEPFFSETIGRCFSHTFNSSKFKSYSDINVLPEWVSSLNCVAPTAFIFHVSRCGSTLISQLLGLSNRHIVLAEVTFIDEMLRLTKTNTLIPEFDTEQLLQAAIAIYGQNRSGLKERLFIKADSWHIHFMPLLRKLYPQVPFILLYRRPDEVIRSHQKLRGMQAVPGVVPNEFLGIDPNSTSATDLDGHMAKVLESYFSAFIRESQRDPRTLLLNYNEGIMSIMQSFCNFTGVTLHVNDWEEIIKRSQYNAKYPEQIFTEVQPIEAAPSYQQQAFTLYNQLEELRMAQALPK